MWDLQRKRERLPRWNGEREFRSQKRHNVDENIIIKCRPDFDGKIVQLRTELERYETNYKIILEIMDKTGELIGKKIEKEVDISQFFTSDGSFYEAGLDAIMKDLVDIHYLKQKDQ